MPIVLDLDGTLFDTRRREELCRKNGQMDWDCWFSDANLRLDVVNEGVLRFIKGLGEDVYIVSARIWERQGVATISQLGPLGLEVRNLLMKPESWRYVKEYIYKARAAVWLASHGVVINHVIDDNEAVLDTISTVLPLFGYREPQLWLVRDGKPVRYEPRPARIAWVPLEPAGDSVFKAPCPAYNMLKIAKSSDTYHALAIDCPGEPRLVNTFIEALKARVMDRRGVHDWVSPIVNITFD